MLVEDAEGGLGAAGAGHGGAEVAGGEAPAGKLAEALGEVAHGALPVDARVLGVLGARHFEVVDSVAQRGHERARLQLLVAGGGVDDQVELADARDGVRILQEAEGGLDQRTGFRGHELGADPGNEQQ